jgi:hypothetical protein
MFLNRHARFAAFALLLCLASASRDAQAFDRSASTFLQGTPEQITQTATFKESLTQADANNFAVARADAAAGTVGVAVATRVVQAIDAGAGLSEQWNCLGCTNPGPLTFQVTLEGTLGPNIPDEGPNNGFTGNFDAKGRTTNNAAWDISLDFAWNGSSLSGFKCSTSPTNGGAVNTHCDPLTLATTTLPDGSTAIQASLSLLAPCTFPSICYISGSFTTSLSLGAGFDPAPGPISVDALNTFGFNIYTTDPSNVWTSDSGRTSIAAVSAVPEPGALPLVSLGLLLLVPLAHRGRRRE